MSNLTQALCAQEQLGLSQSLRVSLRPRCCLESVKVTLLYCNYDCKEAGNMVVTTPSKKRHCNADGVQGT